VSPIRVINIILEIHIVKIEITDVGIKIRDIILRIKINICQAIVISKTGLHFSQSFRFIDLSRNDERIKKAPPNAQE
jgi:hypothetical protein